MENELTKNEKDALLEVLRNTSVRLDSAQFLLNISQKLMRAEKIVLHSKEEEKEVEA